MTHQDDTLQAWIEQAIIGLNLCPFARSPWKDGLVRTTWSTASSLDDAFDHAIDELDHLLNVPASEVATTLVVFPQALSDFYDFIDLASSFDALLEDSGAHQLVQLATFHPDYLFEGEDPEDVSHYTNRSPWPIFHLLRQEDVTRAAALHHDTLSVPEANIATLDDMGEARVRQMWSSWLKAE